MTREQIIDRIVTGELSKRIPRTQEDCCAIAAKASLAVGPALTTDRDVLSAAHGMARGLFGPAFAAADYAQRTTWIDMCERALRAEMEGTDAL